MNPAFVEYVIIKQLLFDVERNFLGSLPPFCGPRLGGTARTGHPPWGRGQETLRISRGLFSRTSKFFKLPAGPSPLYEILCAPPRESMGDHCKSFVMGIISSFFFYFLGTPGRAYLLTVVSSEQSRPPKMNDDYPIPIPRGKKEKERENEQIRNFASLYLPTLARCAHPTWTQDPPPWHDRSAPHAKYLLPCHCAGTLQLVLICPYPFGLWSYLATVHK